MTVDTLDLGLPHLTVVGTLGRGGFSVVYEAIDNKLNRRVAVKVLTGTMDDASRSLFDQECRIHGPLSSHPNIVTIHDAGYTPLERPYLVMEYLEAGSVHDHLHRNGPLDGNQADEWMIPICDAVETAHRAGVLHRDIKPANILLSADGPKLADFGIACGSDATSPQFAVSWLHAPPEASVNKRDERSDVYSLGSTLFQLIAGRAPFERDGEDSMAGVLRRIVDEPAPLLPTTLAPQWLADLVAATLDKDPARRPPSAESLRLALLNGRRGRAGAIQPVPAVAAPPTAAAVAIAPAASTSIGTAGPARSGAAGTVGGPTQHAAAFHPNQGAAASVSPSPKRKRALLPAVAVAVALAAAALALSPALGAALPGSTSDPTPTSAAPTTAGVPTTMSGDGAVDETTIPATESTTTVAEGSTTTSGESTTSTLEGSTTSTTEATTSTTEATTSTTEPTTTSTTEPTTSTTEAVTDGEVPPVIGLERRRAIDALTAAGFEHITVVERSSDTVEAGQVLASNPTAGTIAPLADPITITVSTGPAPVVVPDVVGLDQTLASDLLTEAGLEPVLVRVDVEEGSGQHGLVLSQDPGAGADVAAGTEVTLQIGWESTPPITIGPIIGNPAD